jgi:4-diphosphocytidyl-2-C-methyl-D-erythritol kinase
VILFPNCKINLGLRILRKRPDGYHDLETVFYPLALKDVLEVVPQKENVQFSMTGYPVEGKPEDNLCIRAYELLKKDFSLPPVEMHLHKAIPAGAGLGGGSADGAFMLKLLNQQFNLGLSTEKLINYALQLGSDCPFFIINKPCFATGRGELLEPVNQDLSAYKFVMVNPGINVSTAWAFSQLSGICNASHSLNQIIQQPVETWKNDLINDFEAPVLKQHPEIKTVKEKLYKAGAEYASMSGSGSTVYGIFKKEVRPAFSFPENWFVKELFG